MLRLRPLLRKELPVPAARLARWLIGKTLVREVRRSPAPAPVPPADPGPTGTTSTTTPPADTGTAAVVPAA